ncbi:SWI/SNF chromatin-remodeling complex subunit [Tieghemiomyces parasiticus]|uniref:SWI/SNF chromatin-remodeling complex subunit n=1 Tax=Tieghemiomyces parasiticus TaxID=78921 RepID=A0A9W8ALL2_9FUNG|nr:SWI/SNF chromatin-remodeling complex subunit [Tieghemiomyces parasiticus]
MRPNAAQPAPGTPGSFTANPMLNAAQNNPNMFTTYNQGNGVPSSQPPGGPQAPNPGFYPGMNPMMAYNMAQGQTMPGSVPGYPNPMPAGNYPSAINPQFAGQNPAALNGMMAGPGLNIGMMNNPAAMNAYMMNMQMANAAARPPPPSINQVPPPRPAATPPTPATPGSSETSQGGPTTFTQAQLQAMNLEPPQQQRILELQRNKMLDRDTLNLLRQLHTVAVQNGALPATPSVGAEPQLATSPVGSTLTPNPAPTKSSAPPPAQVPLQLHQPHQAPPGSGGIPGMGTPGYPSGKGGVPGQGPFMTPGQMMGRPPYQAAGPPNPWLNFAQGLGTNQQKAMLNNYLQQQQQQQQQQQHYQAQVQAQAMQRFRQQQMQQLQQQQQQQQQQQSPQQPGMFQMGQPRPPGQTPDPGTPGQAQGSPSIRRQGSNPAPIQPRPQAHPVTLMHSPMAGGGLTPGSQHLLSPIGQRFPPGTPNMGQGASGTGGSQGTAAQGNRSGSAGVASPSVKMSLGKKLTSPPMAGGAYFSSPSGSLPQSPLATPTYDPASMQTTFSANLGGRAKAVSPKSKSHRKKASIAKSGLTSPRPPSTPVTPSPLPPGPRPTGPPHPGFSVPGAPASLASTLAANLYSTTDAQAFRPPVRPPPGVSMPSTSLAGTMAVASNATAAPGTAAAVPLPGQSAATPRPVLPPPPPPPAPTTKSLPPQKRKFYESAVHRYRADQQALQQIGQRQAIRTTAQVQQAQQEIELRRRLLGNHYIFPAFTKLPSAEAVAHGPPLVRIDPHGRTYGQRRHVAPKFTRTQLRTQAVAEERLVPIRLELEADGHKLRDTFTWNLTDELVAPELFAEILCEDLGLPGTTFVAAIVRQIREQLADFEAHGYVPLAADHADVLFPAAGSPSSAEMDTEAKDSHALVKVEGDGGPAAGVDPDLRVLIRIEVTVGNAALTDQFEWDIGRSIITEAYKVKQAVAGGELDGDDIDLAGPLHCRRCGGQPTPPLPDQVTPAEAANPDNDHAPNALRPQAPPGFGLFKVDGTHFSCICRRFDMEEDARLVRTTLAADDLRVVRLNTRLWELGQDCQDPERFAAAFCADLGLSGEFLTAIAHSIREQLFTYTKSLLLLGYPFDGSATLDDTDLHQALLGPFWTVVRPAAQLPDFTPQLAELSALELERKEKDDDRDIRRKRRQTRGRRGILLPDREPLKTTRTLWRFGYNAVHAGRGSLNEDLLSGDAVLAAIRPLPPSGTVSLANGTQAGSIPPPPRSLFAGHEVVDLPPPTPTPAVWAPPTPAKPQPPTDVAAGTPEVTHHGMRRSVSSVPRNPYSSGMTNGGFGSTNNVGNTIDSSGTVAHASNGPPASFAMQTVRSTPIWERTDVHTNGQAAPSPLVSSGNDARQRSYLAPAGTVSTGPPPLANHLPTMNGTSLPSTSTAEKRMQLPFPPGPSSPGSASANAPQLAAPRSPSPFLDHLAQLTPSPPPSSSVPHNNPGLAPSASTGHQPTPSNPSSTAVAPLPPPPTSTAATINEPTKPSPFVSTTAAGTGPSESHHYQPHPYPPPSPMMYDSELDLSDLDM